MEKIINSITRPLVWVGCAAVGLLLFVLYFIALWRSPTGSLGSGAIVIVVLAALLLVLALVFSLTWVVAICGKHSYRWQGTEQVILAQARSYQSEIDNLESQLTAESKHRSDLEHQIVGYQSEIKDLESELATANRHIAALKHHIALAAAKAKA